MHRQIYLALRAAILSRSLPKGTYVPATRVLMRQLACSRTTVLKAYDQLIAEGITSLNQIAEMNDEQIFALDEKLGLKGKSKREEWVTQAKELVAGKASRAKIDQKAADAVKA